MPIFKDYAPKFWEAGIPAHPTRGKAAFLPAWQRFADQLPTEAEQRQWLDMYEDYNIGIVLGAQSGIMVLDIDIDDQRLINKIRSVIPDSPWVRTGKKGMMLAYRYTGPDNRTFRLKDRDGHMLVECLAARVNVIVPPSIHPETNRPYHENVPLYELKKSELPVLPSGLDAILAGVLEDEGIKIATPSTFKVAEWIPAGARDNAMVSHAGVLSRSIIRGERTLLEGLQEMEHWVNTFTENVVGDPLSPEKAKQKLLEFFVRDVHHAKKALPYGWDDGLDDDQKKQMGVDFSADATEWSFQEIIDYMQAETVRHAEDPDDAAMMLIIDKVLGYVNRNKNLKVFEVEKILRFISDQTGKSITVSSLRKQLSEMQKADLPGETHTDIAAALKFDMERFSPIRFSAGKFYRWCGSHWDEYDETNFYKQIQREFNEAPAARKHNDHKQIVEALKKMLSADLKESPKSGINFANGFLDERLEMHEHDPAMGMTYCLPYMYEPEKAGHCPQFFQFLEDCWGEDPDYEEKVQACREAIGVTLMGIGPRFQRAICLYGASGSGKSQLVDIVRGLLPDGATSSVRPDDFNDRFLPAQLVGSVMNICGEISETRKIAGDYFKQIVEGSTITIQNKGKEPFKYAPHATHWFLTNHPPQSRDTSAGFVRRWLFLQFNKKVPTDRKRVGLAQEIIVNERSAIAAWAVQCVPDLLKKRDFTQPTSHNVIIEDLANDLNTVRFFLTRPELVRLGKEAHKDRQVTFITERQLHDAFWSFSAATEGVRPVGLKTFRKMMKNLAPELGFRPDSRLNPDTQFPETVYYYITLVDGF